MSIWTHVCGNIRVNKLRLCREEYETNKQIEQEIQKHINEFTKILGEQIDYEDVLFDYENQTKLPIGREGSIQYNIWTNPDPCYITAYNVAIFGDIRDYDNIQEIKGWFNDVCNQLDIRDAVLSVESTVMDKVIFSYIQNDENPEGYLKTFEIKGE